MRAHIIQKGVNVYARANLGIIHMTGGDNLTISDDKMLLEGLEKLGNILEMV